MGFVVPRRSLCGSGSFLQNRPRSSLDYKIGWFRKWLVLQAGMWGQMRHAVAKKRQKMYALYPSDGNTFPYFEIITHCLDSHAPSVFLFPLIWKTHVFPHFSLKTCHARFWNWPFAKIRTNPLFAGFASGVSWISHQSARTRQIYLRVKTPVLL